MSKEVEVINVSTGEIRTPYDEYIYDRLARYCHKMQISMNSVQINDRLYLQFAGNEFQMSELKAYLESK